jgi:thiol-disulfide isomerase/thioredoxin
MAPERRRALVFAAVAVGAGAAGLWLGARPPAGSPLEQAELTDLEGRARRIAEWRGRVVVVNFWATWCAPCREEIPMLMEVRGARAASGLEIVGIAVDNPAKVMEYAANIKITYPVLLAEANGLDLIRSLGNTSGGLPYTVFLDRQGTPVSTRLGALKKPEIDTLLDGLMK